MSLEIMLQRTSWMLEPFEQAAPRPMKMGNIASPWRYEAGAN
jgi:hypothetical protein